MQIKYYLPIKSSCLSHYFGGACLKPSKYYVNKPDDIQSKFYDFLLITNSLGVKDANCCLELVLTNNEINSLIKIEDCFFLLQNTLPISRVSGIYFKDKEQMQRTITNITMSTAFIPNELIKIREFDSIDTSNLNIPSNIEILDLTSKNTLYDKLLGAFALMRLAGWDFMNYSENYFSTLSFFNKVIKDKFLSSGNRIVNKFWDFIEGEGAFKSLMHYLNKTIDESDVYEIATEENQEIRKDNITRLINIDILDKATYIIAVLNTFGVGSEAKKKRIDCVIVSNFKSNIKTDKSEIIALCYGFNRGYCTFNNYYRIANKERLVKFKLDSQLDYYTIESIYQYVFNGMKTDAFSYIDNWCPKYMNNIIFKKENDYQILDVYVINKFKYTEEVLNILKRIPKNFRCFAEDAIQTIYSLVYTEFSEEFTKIGLKDKNIKSEQRSLQDEFNIKSDDSSEIYNDIIYYQNLSKDELLKLANKLGIKEIRKSWKKDKMIDSLINRSSNPKLL